VAAVAAEFALMPRTSRPTGIANLTEDLAQLVVHRLQHRRMLLQRPVPERGEGGDSLVDARVASGAGGSGRVGGPYGVGGADHREPFGIHVRYSTHMRSAEECREALEKLAGRLAELSPADRENYFGDRTISVTIPDLDVTFTTRLGTGDDPVTEQEPGSPPADIRMTANSDEVVSLAESPMNIARAWVAGRVKIEASMKDLFRLRRLL
jgi:SCP-2 sterol transfer family protein